MTPDNKKWVKALQDLRKTLNRERQDAADFDMTFNPMTDASTGEESEATLEEVCQDLGIEKSQTPATGNCQFYSLAEAGLQNAFADNTGVQRLQWCTKLIKTGIRAAAMLYFFMSSQRRITKAFSRR